MRRDPTGRGAALPGSTGVGRFAPRQTRRGELDLGLDHALLLQGPAGPFLWRLAEELRRAGTEVSKVNFHAGDDLFYPGGAPFRGTLVDWPAFVRRLMVERRVDGLFVFGDCRPLHAAAAREAEALGVPVFVLEEGYLRPDLITLEEHGVNGRSRMPKDPAFYRDLELPPRPDLDKLGGHAWELGWYSALNALAFTLGRARYPRYAHHRILDAWYHTYIHVRGAVRKARFARREAPLLDELTGPRRGRFWLVPLQVHCDFQLVHSPYRDVLEFVREVAAGFAANAGPDDALVFKHHPMDRAYREYGAFFRELAREHALEERLYYVHDLHLPSLIEAARGTLTINSTAGLESLRRGTPVLTFGDAVYDIPGLTFQEDLASFLSDPGPIDRELLERFLRYLLYTNQANGSFYKRPEGRRNPTGVRWPRGSEGLGHRGAGVERER